MPVSGRVSALVAAGARRWLWRLFFGVVVAAGFVFAATVLLVRLWLFPNISEYGAKLAAEASSTLTRKVTIGDIEGDWLWLNPRLVLHNVDVWDEQGQVALHLGVVDAKVSWLSLLSGRLRLAGLSIDAPSLVVERRAGGDLFVAGIPIEGGGGEQGFGPWLLRQREIIISNANLIWRDDFRGAPPLILSRANLVLENRFGRHRFGFRAVPPASLGGTIDLRGDLRGMRFDDRTDWRGRLYVRMAPIRFSGFAPWMDLPYGIDRGDGVAQAWVDLWAGQVVAVNTDFRLRQTMLRLAPTLPPLEIGSLGGRLGFARTNGTDRVSVEKLSLQLADGTHIAPLDLALQVAADHGTLSLSGINVGALGRVASYFPLPEDAAAKLTAFHPEGEIHDLAAEWSGKWKQPENLSVSGSFRKLGWNEGQGIPSVHGFSGQITLGPSRGALTLDSHDLRVDLPNLFPKTLAFDRVQGKVDWSGDHWGLDKVVFANPDISGSVEGSLTLGDAPTADLKGTLGNTRAAAVYNYLPSTINADALRWLKAAFLDGNVPRTQFRLKGDLKRFPFHGGRGGVFEVVAEPRGVRLHYGDGWPDIFGIDATLRFLNDGMEINARSGKIYGATLAETTTVIDNLEDVNGTVRIEGEAAGPSSDFLRFLHESPLQDVIAGFADDAEMTGKGHLKLALALTLSDMANTGVKGAYRFDGGSVSIGAGVPILANPQGILNFTEKGLSAEGIRVAALGGTGKLDVKSQKDGRISITGTGVATADGIMETYGGAVPFLRGRLDGATPWKARVEAGREDVSVVVDAPMDAMAIRLPMPLSKEKSVAWPLHLELKASGHSGSLLSFGVANRLAGILAFDNPDSNWLFRRGTVALGAVASLMEQEGLWIKGSAEFIDYDAWKSVFVSGEGGGERTSAQAGGAPPVIAGAALAAKQALILGRSFHNVRTDIVAAPDRWQVIADSDEVAGKLQWLPAGNGKLVARLTRLNIGAPQDTISAPRETAPSVANTAQYPDLDIVAENTVVRGHPLGRLQATAKYQGQLWRVSELKLEGSEYRLQANGVWQRRPKDEVNATLTIDFDDAGKFLDRFGFTDTLTGGKGRLEGKFSWPGRPADISFDKLSGAFSLDIGRGQFLKADPGIGKLISVLSLSFLPRLITLDFGDVFSQGFGFDHISTNVTARDGLLSSDDFVMEGPSAVVRMNGKVNLASETQDLTVKVAPVLGGTVSGAAYLLGGPVVGLTTLLVQKLLNDPFGQMVGFAYRVTGGWEQPKVTKLGGSMPTETPKASPAPSPTGTLPHTDFPQPEKKNTALP